MKTPLRIALALLALAFACVGVSFWFAPEVAAAAFGLEAAHGTGRAALRADLGGLFVGLGVLCAAGAWTRRRAPLAAAATLLAATATGRALGFLAEGGLEFGARELVFELAALALLAAALHGGAEPARPARARRVLRGVLAAGAVLALAAAGALLSPTVQEAVFARAAAHLSARTNLAPFENDALRVAIAGSSAPLPSASRAKACVVVFAGGKFWVVDSGPESVENLVLWGIPLARIGGVLLTHFHSDHIGDLGELQLQTWAGGRQAPLDVYGGPGVEQVVAGFNQAYALDQGYRTDHHGEQVMPSATWGLRARTVALDGAPTPAKDRSALVYDDGELRITALEVDHAPIEPSYAYRFDYKGRAAVVTGDLKYHLPLAVGAADADLLVSEAISRGMTHSLEEAAHGGGRERTAAILHDVQDYHISPEEAAQLANEARVGHLAFYHLLPAPDGWLPRRLFARGVNAVRPSDWSIADDGTLYTLPLGSREILLGRVDG